MRLCQFLGKMPEMHLARPAAITLQHQSRTNIWTMSGMPMGHMRKVKQHDFIRARIATGHQTTNPNNLQQTIRFMNHADKPYNFTSRHKTASTQYNGIMNIIPEIGAHSKWTRMLGERKHEIIQVNEQDMIISMIHHVLVDCSNRPTQQ